MIAAHATWSHLPSTPPASPPVESLCDQHYDYIVIGAGAGGSAAAGMLNSMQRSFMWFDAGDDEVAKQGDTWYQPSGVTGWDSSAVPELYFDENQILYSIPRVIGGQTAHYAGVNYWTDGDTRGSTNMTMDESIVLEFVRNVTLSRGVQCDEFNPKIHSHFRTATEPNTEDDYAIFNNCMYGTCFAQTCNLNAYFWDQATPRWKRGSAYTEYRGHVQTNVRVLRLVMEHTKIAGVIVRYDNGTESFTCAAQAVLLAGGVMGNAKLLIPDIVPHYDVIGQPVIVLIDPSMYSCLNRTGGTMIKYATKQRPGFLSTLAVCTDNDRRRVYFATPQAINNRISGRMSLNQSTLRHRLVMHYDDTTLQQLVRDVKDTLGRFNLTYDGVWPTDFTYAAYHWTGTDSLTHQSLVHGTKNLFIADALAVRGTTRGWTSWNARIAGALAAWRAVRTADRHDTCENISDRYITNGCCGSLVPYCRELRYTYQENLCCRKIY